MTKKLSTQRLVRDAPCWRSVHPVTALRAAPTPWTLALNTRTLNPDPAPSTLNRMPQRRCHLHVQHVQHADCKRGVLDADAAGASEGSGHEARGFEARGAREARGFGSQGRRVWGLGHKGLGHGARALPRATQSTRGFAGAVLQLLPEFGIQERQLNCAEVDKGIPVTFLLFNQHNSQLTTDT